MNRKRLYIIWGLLILASVLIVMIFNDRDRSKKSGYKDGVEYIDPDTIVLNNSGAKVSFSEVILSGPQETRKLVVMEQEAEVSATIDKSKIKNLDFDIFKQNQTVRYKAKGSFIVNLDSLKPEDIVDDRDSKTLTIRIKHPELDTIEIDPHKISIGEQRNGFLAFGKLELSVNDYVALEQELQGKLKTRLDISANGQEADDNALEMVKAIYEPVVHAIDPDYKVVIEFQPGKE